jgi:hypothetical protein
VNRAEVATLLGAASAVDPKVPQPDPDVLTMWSGILGDVPADIAGAAVRDHYRHSSETVMPANIVEHWRTVRRDVAEHKHAAELRARSAEQRRYLSGIRDGVTRCVTALAITRGADPEHAEAEVEARRAYLAVACSWCKARPGALCTGPGGRPLTKQPAHDVRLTDAMAAAR